MSKPKKACSTISESMNVPQALRSGIIKHNRIRIMFKYQDLSSLQNQYWLIIADATVINDKVFTPRFLYPIILHHPYFSNTTPTKITYRESTTKHSQIHITRAFSVNPTKLKRFWNFPKLFTSKVKTINEVFTECMRKPVKRSIEECVK